MLIAILHFLSDADDPRGIVAGRPNPAHAFASRQKIAVRIVAGSTTRRELRIDGASQVSVNTRESAEKAAS